MKRYDEVMGEISCLRNCGGLPKNSVFYVSRNDLYIPSEDQEELVDCVRRSCDCEVFRFGFGHIFSHVWFGVLNRFGKIRW